MNYFPPPSQRTAVHLLNRFPKFQQITPVYAVGVAILYTWTTYQAFKAFSTNWSMFLGVGDILSLFAYMLAGNFLESLLLIGALLALSFVLPGRLLTEKFVARGSILTITFLGSIIAFYLQLSSNLVLDAVLENIGTWIKLFAVPALIVLAAVEWIKGAGGIVELIADRCIVFLYLYLPLTFLSLLLIVWRNVSG